MELSKRGPRLEALLEGTGMSAARLRSIVVGALARNPTLLECTIPSLVQVAMQGAELGLEIGGVLGEAYIVPFFNSKKSLKEAVYMTGYKGLIKLAEQGGKVLSMESVLVRDGERFTVHRGTAPSIEHEPAWDLDAPVTYAYAVAHRISGPPQFDVMTRRELDEIKRKAVNKGNRIWQSDEAEMQRKSPIRRLAKYVPLGERGRTAIELEAMQDERPGAVTARVSEAMGGVLEGEFVE